MAHSSPPPAYQEKFIIVLIGEDTQLKSLIGQLLCRSADSVSTEDGLIVTDSGTFKVITMPDFGVHQIPNVIDCMALSQPGPHLFILAIDSRNNHVKKAEEDISVLQKYFGDSIIKYLVVMVKDMDSYQALSPLEEQLGFRLATANENMQRQCKEWCSGSAYNYEHSINPLLTQRRRALETELRRDQQHPRTPHPSTDKKTSGSSSPQTDAHPPESAPGRSTDGQPGGVSTSSQTAAEAEQPAPESGTDVNSAGKSDVFNIILMGQTASGKSASANTILSTLACFNFYKHQFKSKVKSVPVTTKCEVVTLKAFGVKIRIVDTPDFFHDQVEDAEAEVEQCRRYCRPDQCVVLLVMQAGRFTDGERELLENLEERMGWRIRNNTIILLTHGDNLTGNCDEYINRQSELRNLVFKCNDRCVLFKNTSKDPQQVMELIRKIPDYKKIFPKLTDAISKNRLLFMMSSPL